MGQDIQKRWKECIVHLVKKNQTEKEHFIDFEYEIEPALLENELRLAIQQPPPGKASGPDSIPIEFKALGPESVKVIAKLCQQIWNTAEWPVDRKTSLYCTV